MNEVTDWLTQIWRRTAVLPVLLHLARRDLKRGRLARAKARFLRCTQLVPFSFPAHFGLACIYLRERDYSRAQRELMLAREIAPSRFRACKARLSELGGFIDTSVGDGSTAGAHPAALSNGVSTVSAVEDNWLGESGSSDGWSADSPPFPGDFASHDEWMKFRRMGPISDAEVATVDWDHVVAQILRHGA